MPELNMADFRNPAYGAIDPDHKYQPGFADADGNPIPQPMAGVTIRYTPEGIAVYMYNDRPGVFLGEHGQEFPQEMAEMAHYPVEELAVRRKRLEAMAAAGKAIDEEFAQIDTKVAFLTRGDYTLFNLGSGRFTIEYKDGTSMTPTPLSQEISMKVMDRLAPGETVKEKK